MDSQSANKSIPDKTNRVPLNCPRCGSCNTKFCYYNNYSLSQPRHFCRSCKRYWTKGGTLRNVPIGGGSRRKKLPRRRDSSSATTVLNAAAATNPSFQQQRPPDLISNFNLVDDSLFQSFWKNPIGADFPISRMNDDYSARICPNGSAELGFSTTPGGLVAAEPCLNAGDSIRIGSREIQEAMASSTRVPKLSSIAAAGDDSSVLFGSTSFASSTSTMARLLAFGLQKQKREKEVTMMDVNYPNPNLNPNPVEQINASSSSSIPWNTSNFAAWIN